MRRSRWATGLAAVLAAAGLGGAAWQQRAHRADAGGREAVAAAAAATPVEAASAGLATRAAAAVVPPPTLAEFAAVPHAAASAPSQEICGIGTATEADLLRAQADPAQGRARAQLQRRAEAGLVRIAARLAAGNERQQVAARLLMDDPDGAALLAERSGDAMAYQMALNFCGATREDAPHCARLSARRWAELDPSDARPWLRLMEQARVRKDAAGVDAALAEAAARPRLSRGSFLLETQAAAVADAVPDIADFGPALVAVIGMDAAMPGVDLDVALKACRVEALGDATRLGHCRTLARQLLANAGDLLDAGLALRMAERAGVPREQQAFNAATLKAAGDRYLERVVSDVGLDCAAMRRTRQFATERAAHGELAMALALLRTGPASGTAR